MGERRKRQRLSEDGTAAVTATVIADNEQPPKSVKPSKHSKPAPKDDSQKQLFVRSLASTVTTDDLTQFFSDSYPIKHALVVLDRQTKESKGYGFVTFADAEDAQRAMEELNGSEFQGKKIKVEAAEARSRDVQSDVPGQKKSVGSAAAKAKADREEQKEQQSPKLIVRNLPWSIKKPEQLQKLFLSFGKVHFVTLPKNHNGELKGFGFVAVRGRKNAEKAMAELNGREIDGRTIAVDWAVDKETWQTLQKTSKDEDSKMDGEVAVDVEGSDVSSVVSESDDGLGDSEDDEAESEDEDSNTDYEGVSDDDAEGGVRLEEVEPKREEYSVFIRNLPFTVDDDSLYEHFTQFGPIRYARVVFDRETEKPKGCGFVCFYTEEALIDCLKGVPRVKLQKKTSEKKDGTTMTVTHSVLENEDSDPTGKYTIDGRILQLSRAVNKNEATRLTTEGATVRFNRDKDKRRLYLLSEGTISAGSPLYEKLAPSEVTMREASAKQRQKLIQSNPSLHLSLTRLSIRNIPRSLTSKDLKQLARQAVVGFAADAKGGKRSKLSKEELARGGDAMLVAEKIRKKRGKGIVRQAKIVFETKEGSKVTDKDGAATEAGRSRGYGFIEYYTHRNALMGLRWLNGHAVDYRVKAEQQPATKGSTSNSNSNSKKADKEALEDRKKRLIVEFAIENANVVSRRSERESAKADGGPKGAADGEGDGDADKGHRGSDPRHKHKLQPGGKRKRDAPDSASGGPLQVTGKGKRIAAGADAAGGAADGDGDAKAREKTAQRTRIIAKKRNARRARKTGKA
ncbi:hypothetical protein BDV95DRAFT_631806 [Massariosphaeria phaeospora]|uniref:RRM domain-containing protein n=1 Tax=Massariosphaeria phaeospora TaxID=100035 RepID=A0A7C8M0Q2_9PLEO|nr:hypothetical protein BDV95DRAFT_631806 [Massariosphaeria phaeospora]